MLVRDGVAVEVTGRSARRLFGLRGLAPLAAAVAPPRRPEPGRGRGRPRRAAVGAAPETPPALPAPLGPLERRAFDYRDLAAAMQEVEAAIRRAPTALSRPAGRGPASGPGGVDPREEDRPGAAAGGADS
jgi:hypothetical protein